MTTRERINAAKSYIRGHQPEPTKVVRTRQRYKWGVKNYLTSFKVGETRKYDGRYRYDSLRSQAVKLKKDYGCLFGFYTSSEGKFITRIK